MNDAGLIFRRTAGGWQLLPGAAKDIDVGADGSAWVIGTNPVPGGFGIYRFNGSGWDNVPGGAVRIGVGPDGLPWVVNSGGSIFRRSSNDWQLLPGAAVDIDVGDGPTEISFAEDINGTATRDSHLATVFGLAPSTLTARLQAQVDRLERDLQRSEPATSKARGGPTSSDEEGS